MTVNDVTRCARCKRVVLFVDEDFGLCGDCLPVVEDRAADACDYWCDRYTPDPEPPLAVTVRVSLEGR